MTRGGLFTPPDGLATMQMMTDPSEVLRHALQLPEEARAALAKALLQSLDGTPDAGADTAWAKEIERRLRQVDDGTATLMSWEDAKKKISG